MIHLQEDGARTNRKSPLARAFLFHLIRRAFQSSGSSNGIIGRVILRSSLRMVSVYKRLIAVAPMKNVTSRFAMERMKYTTAYPLHPRAFRDRRAADNADEE